MKKKNEGMAEKTDSLTLDEGDCAVIVRSTGELKFIHNEPSEEMDELQMSAAGALIAISLPEWRNKLIELLMSGGALVHDEQINEDDLFRLGAEQKKDWGAN